MLKNIPMLSAALILFSLCVQNTQADSFYGIEIGGAFVMRECSYEIITKEMCTKSDEVTRHPWGSITHEIVAPLDSVSAIGGFKQYGFNATEFDGKVVYISAMTYGADWQDETLKALITKFGKPNSIKKTPLQNMFGAKILGLSASWKKPSYKVEFKGVDGEIDSGKITIETASSSIETLAREQWLSNNRPNSKM